MFSLNGMTEPSQHTLILVSSHNSSIASLSPIEIRKLFLGVPIMHKGQLLKPLRNATDALMTEVFLQKIIFMSKRSYDRELLSRVYRLGGKRPEIYSENTELIKELRDIPGALTYMWSNDIIDNPGLKSLGVIWTGSIN